MKNGSGRVRGDGGGSMSLRNHKTKQKKANKKMNRHTANIYICEVMQRTMRTQGR